MEWVEQFYKTQYLLLKSHIEDISETLYEKEVKKIIEQVGKPFGTILELGSGIGKIDNSLAQLGKQVTTIELVKELTDHAKKTQTANVNILCGDFYEINIEEKFDLLLYLDGFGIGNDEDQLRLLRKIHNWLSDDGYALIDIYEPNYWRQVFKSEMHPGRDSTVIRKYDYDVKESRMIDTWWHVDSEDMKFSQSLACYTPEEIYELCQKAGLEITAYFPDGAMDYDNWIYHDIAPINCCISYRVKIKKK